MNSIETRKNKIISLLNNKMKADDVSYGELAQRTGMAKSTLQRYISGTTAKIPLEAINKMAHVLNVTEQVAAVMTANNDDQLPPLTQKDNKNIEKIVSSMRERLVNEEGLMFDGKPASPEAIQSILDAMTVGMGIAKQRNKAKYTPKKYRDKNKE